MRVVKQVKYTPRTIYSSSDTPFMVSCTTDSPMDYPFYPSCIIEIEEEEFEEIPRHKPKTVKSGARCRYCRVLVMEEDRYCVACGAPQ